MTWIVLGSCMFVIGIYIFIWALCKISADADRHIEYQHYYYEEDKE